MNIKLISSSCPCLPKKGRVSQLGSRLNRVGCIGTLLQAQESEGYEETIHPVTANEGAPNPPYIFSVFYSLHLPPYHRLTLKTVIITLKAVIFRH